ncbi:hypothetical protein [Planktotalea sp.]|uniref:hypothetical protein n=1 Tax=Planktotalea sp. TaxID=2029877 RepID=UPI00329A3BE0
MKFFEGLELHKNGDFQSILQLSVAMNMGFSAVLFYFGDPFQELRQRAKLVRSVWSNIKRHINLDDSTVANSNEITGETHKFLVSNWHLNAAEGLLEKTVLPRWVFIALATLALAFSVISFWFLINSTLLANHEIVKPTWLPIGPRLAMTILFAPIILSLLIPVLVTIFKRKKISEELNKASNALSECQISIEYK